MIVTIDGPAGAGKSTVARAVARRLGFRFLDTGAMYRAVVLAALQRHWPLDQPDEVARHTRRLTLQLDEGRVVLDGDDVTDRLRTSQIADHIHRIADNALVRERLVELQRDIAVGTDIVTEGRDQGTVAFPDAQCQIFLTASPAERARRRLQELRLAGEELSLAEVLRAQEERDRRDATRPVGGLRKAADAVVVMTDNLSEEQVVEQIVRLVEQRRDELGLSRVDA